MLVIIGVLMTPVFACAAEEICLSDGYTEAAVIGTEAEVLADLPVDEDGNIGSDSRFLTRRLIVLSADVDDSCGAIQKWQTAENEIVLEYETEAKAEAAWKKLKKSYACYPDEVLQIGTSGELIDSSLGMEQLRGEALPSDITVAVLDTGIDPKEECFRKGTETGGRISDASYDFLRGTSSLSDPAGHGSIVSGIIARNTPENVEILSCAVLGKAGGESAAEMSTLLLIGAAIRYSMANGADIINMSFSLEATSGSSSSLDYLNAIIQEAYDQGILCTVASGNDGSQIGADDYPACLGCAVTVGAVDMEGNHSDFSNYGSCLDFAAPGEIEEMTGTSAAAPCIAACFAYLRGRDRDASSQDLIEQLRLLCNDPGEPGRDDLYGWGIPDMTALAGESGHHFEKTVTRPATCTEDGLVTWLCSDDGCGASFTEIIPAVGHTWGAEADGSLLRFICRNRGCGAVCDELSGDTPDGFHWKITKAGLNSSGIPVAHLELSGSGSPGRMDEYPWTEFRDYVTTIVLEDTITGIPEGAFQGMKSLVNIVHTDDIEDGARYSGFSSALTGIGTHAFFDCDALKRISIGAGVSSIGDGAFSGCASLGEISVQKGNTRFRASDGCLYDASGKTLLLCVNKGASFSSSVTAIAAEAFYNSNITSVTIPDTVRTIGACAFAGCHDLRSIIFGACGSMSIAADAFRDVNAEIYLPEGTEADWADLSYGGSLRWHRMNLTQADYSVTLEEDNYQFTGKPICPKVTVTSVDGTTVLEEGTDYRLSYSNNVSPGTAGIRITGTNQGYAGVLTASFTIEKAQFHFRYLTVPETVQAGEEIPVTYEGIPLKELEQLEVRFSSEPADMFRTEEDKDGNKILVARKSGTGTLQVLVDGNEYYEADITRKYTVEVLACGPDAHEWDEGITLTEATVTREGSMEYTCLKCGEKKTVSVPKIEDDEDSGSGAGTNVDGKGAPAGSVCKVGKLVYKVKTNDTAELIKAPNKASLTIPAKITINGKKYRVTRIGTKAVYKKSKLKKLVIGSNVRVIGKNAFRGCKKLKTIKIRSKVLKSVGSGAFAKLKKTVVVRVPKAKLKTYHSKLRKAGLKGKKQKVKAY